VSFAGLARLKYIPSVAIVLLPLRRTSEKRLPLLRLERAPSSGIRPEEAKLFTNYRWPVDHVDLRASLCYNLSRLVNSLTNWALFASLIPSFA
jgi:hypothetical protein